MPCAHDLDHQAPHGVRDRGGDRACAPRGGAPVDERRAAGGGRRRRSWRRRSPSAAASPSTSPWPIAVEPTREFALISIGRRAACSRPRRRSPGRWLKPKRFGRRHEPRGAELDAERREHRVARDREGELERAAAFLAVGVAQLDAVERRVGRVGEGRARRGDVRRSSTPESVIILNVEPGGCSAVEADPGDGEDLAAGGLHARRRRRAGRRARRRRRAGRRRDRRAHRVRRARAARRRARVRRPSSSPPGRAAQARVERALEPAECRRRRPAGTPSASSAAAPRGGIGPTSPTTALAASPSGELRRVPGPSAGSRRARSRRARAASRGAAASCARLQRLAACRPGKAQRARPCDPRRRLRLATVRARSGSASVPNSRVRTRTGTSTRPSPRARALPADAQPRRGRGAHRLAVAPRRTRSARSRARRGASMSRVHRRVVAARPRARRSVSASERAGEEPRVRADDRADQRRRPRASASTGRARRRRWLRLSVTGACRTWRVTRLDWINCRVRGGPRLLRLPAGLHRRRAVVRRVRARGIPRHPPGSSAAAAGLRLAVRARVRAGRRAAGAARSSRAASRASAFRLRAGADRCRGSAPLDGAARARCSGAALALGIVWIAAAVAAQTPGARQLRADIQRSAILRELNEVLPPSGPILDALARLDPLPSITGPVARRRAAVAGRRARRRGVRAASRSVVRVLGTACGLGDRGLGLGRRRRTSS